LLCYSGEHSIDTTVSYIDKPITALNTGNLINTTKLVIFLNLHLYCVDEKLIVFGNMHRLASRSLLNECHMCPSIRQEVIHLNQTVNEVAIFNLTLR